MVNVKFIYFFLLVVKFGLRFETKLLFWQHLLSGFSFYAFINIRSLDWAFSEYTSLRFYFLRKFFTNLHEKKKMI